MAPLRQRMGATPANKTGNMDKSPSKSLDDVLSRLEERNNIAVALKNNRGIYTYANNAWSEIAEAPIRKITGSSDHQLPWGARDGRLILSMDDATRRKGRLTQTDRFSHFHRKTWMITTTERLLLPQAGLMVCIVEPGHPDAFCQLASRVTAKGITVNDISLSIRQLYLLHQLLFHVPHKQTARELGCSTNRINQCLRAIRDKFEANDSKELICALSATGLFPLLEHFDLLFRYGWVSRELKYQH